MSVKTANLQQTNGNWDTRTSCHSSTTRKACYQETTTRRGITRRSAGKTTGKTKRISAGLPETKASSYNRANTSWVQRYMLHGPIYNHWPVLKPAGLFQSRLARFKAGQQFNCAIYAIVYLHDIDDQAYGNALSHVVDTAE